MLLSFLKSDLTLLPAHWTEKKAICLNTQLIALKSSEKNLPILWEMTGMSAPLVLLSNVTLLAAAVTELLTV